MNQMGYQLFLAVGEYLTVSQWNKIKLHFFKKHSQLLKIDDTITAADIAIKLQRDNINYMSEDKWIKFNSNGWYSKEYYFYIDNKHSAWIVANSI